MTGWSSTARSRSTPKSHAGSGLPNKALNLLVCLPSAVQGPRLGINRFGVVAYLQSALMMPWMRWASAARALSSMTSRSPAALVRDTRTPESNAALACLARAQFSALAFATRSSSALRFAASVSAVCFFLASSSLSTPEPWAALLDKAGAGAVVCGAEASALTAGTDGVDRCPLGRFKIFFSGISDPDARSLKTLRPSLSTHCHWAQVPVTERAKMAAKNACDGFMPTSVARGMGQDQIDTGTIRFLEL